MKEIQLTQGKVALVDDVDYHRVLKFRWHYSRAGPRRNVNRFTQPLANFIMRVPVGRMFDHINGDKCDCRRANLQEVSMGLLQARRGPNANNTSGYKGVTKHRNKWSAQLGHDGTKQHLGTFLTPEDAARAYDMAVRSVFGDMVYTNFHS